MILISCLFPPTVNDGNYLILAFLTEDIKSDWSIMDPELSNLTELLHFFETAARSAHRRTKIIEYLAKTVNNNTEIFII